LWFWIFSDVFYLFSIFSIFFLSFLSFFGVYHLSSWCFPFDFDVYHSLPRCFPSFSDVFPFFSFISFPFSLFFFSSSDLTQKMIVLLLQQIDIIFVDR
jgi:hypothetical protein